MAEYETQCMHCNQMLSGPRAGTNPGQQLAEYDDQGRMTISHTECPYGAEGKHCPYGKSPIAEWLEQKRKGER